jgi:hypothetical protein
VLIKTKRLFALLANKNALPRLLAPKIAHLAARKIDREPGTKKEMTPDRRQETGTRREQPDFVAQKEGFLSGRVDTCWRFDFVFGAEGEHTLLDSNIHRRVLHFMSQDVSLPLQQSPGGMGLPCGQVLGWPRNVQMR